MLAEPCCNDDETMHPIQKTVQLFAAGSLRPSTFRFDRSSDPPSLSAVQLTLQIHRNQDVSTALADLDECRAYHPQRHPVRLLCQPDGA